MTLCQKSIEYKGTFKSSQMKLQENILLLFSTIQLYRHRVSSPFALSDSLACHFPSYYHSNVDL